MAEETPSTAAASRSVPLTPLGDQPRGVFLGQQIDLGEGDDLRQLIEPGPVARELAADRLVVRLRVALGRRHFDQVNEDATALEVGEELVPEPSALGGTLDQSRDVGEHELAVVELDRAEVGLDGREGVARRPWDPPWSAARAARTCPRWAGRPARRRRAA